VGNGRAVTHIVVDDINGNGYPEVIESGIEDCDSSLTIIWEIEAVRVIYPNGGEELHSGSIDTLRWWIFHPPASDSFSLYISVDGGESYRLLASGLDGDDSMYVWRVPEVEESFDECVFKVVAYGPGESYDESNGYFRIVPTVGVDVGDVAGVVSGLRSVFPNPARDVVEVEYGVGVGSDVKVGVYDVSGRCVRDLVDGYRMSGYHRVVWDTRDNFGRLVSSGVYFVRMKAGERGWTERIVVIR